MILITFYEFGDVKDLADVKYHFDDTVVGTLHYECRVHRLLELHITLYRKYIKDIITTTDVLTIFDINLCIYFM